MLTGQETAIVSDVAGTTTDPVKKSVEIPGIGPVIIVDTAGIDDVGDLGKKRIEKTLDSLKIVDFAILVITDNTFDSFEKDLINKFEDWAVPFLIVHNKSDITKLDISLKDRIEQITRSIVLDFNTLTFENLPDLLSLLRKLIPEHAYQSQSLVGDLLSYGDIVLLIVPIDIEAPEGRLILPQVQAIRDILDNDCVAIVLKEREIDSFLKHTGIKPKLAITDSQLFLKAAASIPEDISLTGFSVVLARQKGDFYNYLKGTPHIAKLKDGDRVLLLESCTHQVSCDDIGRVKIPRWMTNFTGKKLEYEVVAGLNNLPRPITEYAIVVQCGGCVITRKQLINRLKPAVDAGVPVTNYGMAIAYMQGIFDRAVAPFVKTKDISVDYL